MALESDVISGVFLVKYKSNNVMVQSISGISSIRPTYRQKLFKVAVDPSMSIDKVRGLCSAGGEIEYIEPLMLYKLYSRPTAVAVPNDPYYSDQWHTEKVAVRDAWETTYGSSDVVVAIMDTGVQYDHEDISANIWINAGEASGNPGIDDDNNGYVDDIRGWDVVDLSTDPEQAIIIMQGLVPTEDYNTQDNDPIDRVGHGTHCAGIAVAPANNNIGVSGIAPGCRIMSVRAAFATQLGGNLTNETIVNGIEYARINSANVISMSFGGDYSIAIRDAIADAYNAGIVLIAAAGNSNLSLPTYPGGYDGVIAVAATNQIDNKASFSNYGNWVDIAAPGTGILSTISSVNEYSDNYADHKYMYMDGTSMATPLVAGVAALMLSYNSHLTPAEVEYYMKYTADNALSSQYIGAGRINAGSIFNYMISTSGNATTATIRKVFVAPNPFKIKTDTSASIVVQLSGGIEEVSYVIYDITGRKVLSDRKTSAIAYIGSICTFPLDGLSKEGFTLPTGVYYILVTVSNSQGNKNVAKTKMVIIN